MKNIISCIKGFWFYTIITPVLMIGEVLMEVLIPYLTKDVINIGVENGDLNLLLKYGLLMILMAIISLFFGALAGKTSSIASAGLARNLRQKLYYKVQDFSFKNIDDFSTAALVTRMTEDVTNIQQAFMMIIRMCVRAPMMLVMASVMAFTLNKDLSMIFIIVIPLLALALLLVMMKAHPIFIKMFKKFEKLNSVIQEDLIGIRVVKAYVREDFEIERFEEINKEVTKLGINAEKLLILNNPIMYFFMYSCMIVIFSLAGRQIIGGHMLVGDLSTFVTYVMQVLSSLMMISMVFVMIVMSRASIQRVNEVLSAESNIVNCSNPVYEVKDGSISFNNVNFSYNNNDNYVLRNINIDIKAGETVGILGGTGSSKTTFVNLLPRLYDATEGSVEIGGVNVKDYDIKSLRDQVSVVLQKNVLFSGTIKDNLRWGNKNATDEEIIEACKNAQADEFITKFPKQYDTYIEQGGTNVSGGQKQRLCIARALLKNPKILILDDSTSAVDTKTDSMIRTALSTTLKDVTKIIIAQRINSIQDADKIIVMDEGRIAAVGKHEDLLETNHIYQEVYSSQTKGVE